MKQPHVPFLDRPGSAALARIDAIVGGAFVERMAVVYRRQGGRPRSPYRHRKGARA